MYENTSFDLVLPDEMLPEMVLETARVCGLEDNTTYQDALNRISNAGYSSKEYFFDGSIWVFTDNAADPKSLGILALSRDADRTGLRKFDLAIGVKPEWRGQGLAIAALQFALNETSDYETGRLKEGIDCFIGANVTDVDLGAVQSLGFMADDGVYNDPLAKADFVVIDPEVAQEAILMMRSGMSRDERVAHLVSLETHDDVVYGEPRLRLPNNADQARQVLPKMQQRMSDEELRRFISNPHNGYHILRVLIRSALGDIYPNGEDLIPIVAREKRYGYNAQGFGMNRIYSVYEAYHAVTKRAWDRTTNDASLPQLVHSLSRGF